MAAPAIDTQGLRRRRAFVFLAYRHTWVDRCAKVSANLSRCQAVPREAFCFAEAQHDEARLLMKVGDVSDDACD